MQVFDWVPIFGPVMVPFVRGCWADSGPVHLIGRLKEGLSGMNSHHNDCNHKGDYSHSTFYDNDYIAFCQSDKRDNDD